MASKLYVQRFFTQLQVQGGSDKVEDFTRIGNENKTECQCICGHPIKNCFHVRSNKNQNTLVIGSCCIRKFEIKKRCDRCNKEHRNKKDNYCSSCRDVIEIERRNKLTKQFFEQKKEEEERIGKIIEESMKETEEIIKKTQITFGKYKGYTWEYIYKTKASYIKWLLDNEIKFVPKDVRDYYKTKF